VENSKIYRCRKMCTHTKVTCFQIVSALIYVSIIKISQDKHLKWKTYLFMLNTDRGKVMPPWNESRRLGLMSMPWDRMGVADDGGWQWSEWTKTHTHIHIHTHTYIYGTRGVHVWMRTLPRHWQGRHVIEKGVGVKRNT
jgi:hypothetical protein